MSVRLGKRGQIPNWISENDWSAEARLGWIKRIMGTSPRDWGQQTPGDSDCPDAETWVIWCLTCYDIKEVALDTWYCMCDQYRRGCGGELYRV